jgi:hypothetical protein
MFENGGVGSLAIAVGALAGAFFLGKATEKAGLQMGREDVCAQLTWLCDQAENGQGLVHQGQVCRRSLPGASGRLHR